MSDLREPAATVRVEVEGGVATVRVDRPPLNALDGSTQAQLRAAAEQVAGRADVAAVVVTGGDAVFAAGADVKEMAPLSYEQMADRSLALQAAFTAEARIAQPVVAAISGYALGAGCELALCADIRIAAADAVLGQPEILLGLVPGAGGTQRLPRLVGPSRAKDLILTGRRVGAEEALAIGLVDKVVPAGQAVAAARDYAQQFVGGPAYALRAAKQAVDRGLEVDLDSGLEIERLQFTGLFATDDRRTGMASFLERGPGKARFGRH